MSWFKKKKKFEAFGSFEETFESLCKKVYKLEGEVYKLNKLDIELDCLRYGLNPLEHKLIYSTGYNEDDRKEAKQQGFVLKGITRDKHYEIWIKEAAKDEIPKT